MKSALVLRTVRGRWWQLAGLLPFVIYVSSPLVVLALLLVLLVRAGVTTYPMWVLFLTACLVYAGVRVNGRVATIHVPLRSLWLSGAVETRRSLGRRCALAILTRGLGWLPAGLAGTAILELGMHQTSQFDGVFLVALTILLGVALFAGTMRRVTPTTTFWPLAVGMFCGGVSAPLIYIHGVELGWADRSALVLGLAGLAVAVWYALARALARAEIVQ